MDVGIWQNPEMKLFERVEDIPMPWPWVNFNPHTDHFACRCCGRLIIVPTTMDKLQRVRTEFGRPMIITSGYRCSRHNQKVSSSGPNGPHTTGRPVDVKIFGEEALDLIVIARRHGFTGFGIKQKGDFQGRYVHLDDLLNHETGGPRPWIWTY